VIPALCRPGDGAAKERDAVVGALARQQLAVGQPGVVVDRKVQVLPAGTAVAGKPIAVDALTDRPEAAELLDVDVHQLTGPRALIPLHRLPRRQPQPRDAVAAQHLPHRRGRHTELASNDQRACLRVRARSEDPLLELARASARLPLRRRRPIGERRPAACLVAAPEPITARTTGAAGGRGGLRTLIASPARRFMPTLRGA
jgi:hypothetical protein